jgi:Tfp pilus assembly protein PilN
MTNLLPYKEQSLLDNQRHRRLRVAVGVLVSAMFAFATVMLIPSFVILASAKESVEQRLAVTQRLSELQKDNGAGKAIARIKEKTEFVVHQKDAFLPHELFESVIGDAATAQGIMLDSMTFTRAESAITLDVSGAAATRADLIRFGETLKASGLFAQVSIPIDTLAQSTDLRFRLSLALVASSR